MIIPSTIQEYTDKIKKYCRGWNACIDKYGPEFGSETEMVAAKCFGCEICLQYRDSIGCGDDCEPGSRCIVKARIRHANKQRI